MPLGLTIFIIIFILVIIWLVYQLVWGTPLWINLAVERIFFKIAFSDPEALTSLGLLDGSVLDFHSDKLTDASPHHQARQHELDRESLALIRRFEPEKLKGQKRITYRLLRWYFMQNLRGHHFDYHWVSSSVFMGPYPVNHVFGVQVDLIHFLCNEHKINNRQSVRHYLARLKAIPWKFSGLIESIAERETAGVIPPCFVLEKSIIQIDGFLATPIEENPLYCSFLEKVERSKNIFEGEKRKWAEKVLEVIRRDVLPAYRDLKEKLVQLLEKAPLEAGVWHLPNGRDYYHFLLRTHTTIDITAAEIHQLGLDEVERLSKSIRAILDRLGLPTDDPGSQLQALMEAPQSHYDLEDPREEIIRDYKFILDEINQRLPEIFMEGSLDKIVVKRLPEFKEPDSPIAYAEAPAMNGSQPGCLWLNLRDPGNIYQWGMRTLAYHEGIPGHVYQMAHAQKIKGLPTFRRTYFPNAYVEGWALYAERLGFELGLEDDLSNLGRLQALLWRAARLVVDSGIHDKEWTRGEAVDYMVKTTGMPLRDVETEVERYIVMPAQACAYLIGYLKIISLREKAQGILGERFDLKEFHKTIIGQGGLPLELLDVVIDDYIDGKAGLQPVVGG